MTIHTCERCHYQSDRKIDLSRHLQKQKQCPPIYSDVDTQELYDQLHAPKAFPCVHCSKSFVHMKSLRRHIQDHHSNSITPDATETTNVNISNNTENSHNNTEHSHNSTEHSHNNTEHSHNTTTTTTTTTNNRDVYNGNVQIHNNNTTHNHIYVFGNEDLQSIKEDTEFLKNCMRTLDKNGIVDMFERVHLNDDLPQNKNVRFKKAHHPPKLMVFSKDPKKPQDNPSWKLVDAVDYGDIIVLKYLNVIVKENKDQLILPENPTIDEQIDHDIRYRKITNVKEKKRGVYAPIRRKIIEKIKENAPAS